MRCRSCVTGGGQAEVWMFAALTAAANTMIISPIYYSVELKTLRSGGLSVCLQPPRASPLIILHVSHPDMPISQALPRVRQGCRSWLRAAPKRNVLSPNHTSLYQLGLPRVRLGCWKDDHEEKLHGISPFPHRRRLLRQLLLILTPTGRYPKVLYFLGFTLMDVATDY